MVFYIYVQVYQIVCNDDHNMRLCWYISSIAMHAEYKRQQKPFAKSVKARLQQIEMYIIKASVGHGNPSTTISP